MFDLLGKQRCPFGMVMLAMRLIYIHILQSWPQMGALLMVAIMQVSLHLYLMATCIVSA
jgi:hypothetical protein